MDLSGKKIYMFQAGSLLFTFIVCLWGTLAGIVSTWITNEDYSYGFLIPVISGWFIWERRSKFKEINIFQDFRALPFLILFLLFSVYGILGSSYSAVRPSIPFILFFLTLLCFGKHAARLMLFPLAYLIFMVPIPNLMNRYLGEPLKLISSVMGTHIIRAFDITVYREGNIIELPDIQLQVVDACSGLRFLFPLIALGIVYAYYFQKTTWKRIILVMTTLPIAVLTNGLRVGITGILSHYYGSKVAEGFFHDFEGWLIFMVAFAFLFGFGKILSYFPDSPDKSDVPETEYKEISPRLSNMPAFIISLVLLLCVGTLSWSTKALPPVKIKGGLGTFPLEIADWQGRSQTISREIVDLSGAEESFYATYSNEAGERVELYLGYRSTPFMENENFFHTPISCFPGSGWKILKTDTYTFKNSFEFPGLSARRMIAEKMDVKVMVFFWFQTNKRATHIKWLNRLHLALHAIERDNTHDLFVRLITPIQSDNLKEAEERLDRFAFQFSQTLNDFLAKKQFLER
jgi:exosortase D (VPLPA-CTERM-specific)